MTMATTLSRFLTDHQVPYEILAHNHTASSMETAQAAKVPGARVAKSVVLGDEHGYVMAILPATRRVDLAELHRQLNRPLELVPEGELRALFQDCDMGAVPPIGPAYGMDTVVDDCLAEQSDVYLEAGDHEQLIHLTGEDFDVLLDQARHMNFSRRL